jgi:hypothetical protein
VAVRGRKNADEALIVTIAGGATVQAAAQLCEVSERTIYRRLQDVAFKRRLTQARSDMVERALGHLASGSAEAAIVLRNLLAAESDSIKLGAARSILELGNKLRESVELEQRLAALEQQSASKGRR